MADRPIIFSAPMIRALLDGRKTQTRRVLKPQPPERPAPNCHPSHTQKHPEPYLDAYCGEKRTATNPRGMSRDWHWWQVDDRPGPPVTRAPYAPGDRIYVREAHSLHDAFGQDRDDGMRWGPWPGLASSINPERTRIAYYREGFDRSGPPRWRPSIHMPRWASRLTLIVTEVRVQRLHEISHQDAISEGVQPNGMRATPIDRFSDLWNSIHGPDAWDANPWVAAITFDVKRGNIDTPTGGTNDRD